MSEWKQGSKLQPADLDQIADFVASFARVPEGMTTDDWSNSPGVADQLKDSSPFQKECGTCHLIDVADGLTKGGNRDAPKLFGWGSDYWLTRMIRNPRSSDKYGFLDETMPGQMPAFGPERTSASDLEVLIRYMKGDYATQQSQARGAQSEIPGPKP